LKGGGSQNAIPLSRQREIDPRRDFLSVGHVEKFTGLETKE
jgi:hypothetical protein